MADETARTSAGHARSPDPQDRGAGAATWMGDLGAPPSDLQRHTDIRQGSLYPALHRLERRGWIKARWGTSDNNRRAKYYELTKRGRARLETEISAWRKLSAAVAQVSKAS